MNPRQLVVLGALGAVGTFATACGGVLPAHQAASTGAHVVAAAATSTLPPASTPASTPPPAAAASPPAPAQVIVVEGTTLDTTGKFPVELLSTTGHRLAGGEIPVTNEWSVTSADGAAWWLDGAQLIKMDATGTHVMASVPSTANSLSVSPDGSQWVYATSTPANTSGPPMDGPPPVINALYHGGAGITTTQIARRTSDSNHPSADAPYTWIYELGMWTNKGVLIERQPTGGCGCGTAFDMEMSARYVALIDPATGATIDMKNPCTLSGISEGGLGACFQPDAKFSADNEVEFFDATNVEYHYNLSDTTLGGQATFDGATVAYATVPASTGGAGCGGPDWRLSATLRVMNIVSGDAHAVGHLGLLPKAWLRDGTLVGESYTADAAGNTVSTVVDINTATGATTALVAGDIRVVGIA